MKLGRARADDFGTASVLMIAHDHLLFSQRRAARHPATVRVITVLSWKLWASVNLGVVNRLTYVKLRSAIDALLAELDGAKTLALSTANRVTP